MQFACKFSRTLVGVAAGFALCGAAQAQTTAEYRSMAATVTVNIPAPPTTAEGSSLPTQFVTFQSKLSNESKDQLEGWIWRPTNVDPFAKVPLVIVAHGHTGAGTYASPA